MDDDGLFREEALRRFREGGVQGEVLRLGPGWTRWAPIPLVLAALAAVAAAALVTVPVSVQGPAVVTGPGQVLALLPAARRDALEPVVTLWFEGEGAGEPVPLRIDRVEPRVVGAEEARALAGGAFAGRAVPGASVLVRAVGSPPPAGAGRVTVPLGRRRLLDVLLPRGR